MRVLHVSFSDELGGAAIAARRINDALRRAGVDSQLVVLRRSSSRPGVIAPLTPYRALRARLAGALSRRLLRLQKTPNRTVHSLNLFASGLGAWLNAAEADIVHLHWLGGETLSLAEMRDLRHPVVWTLHDMWMFCGAEHYAEEQAAARYRVGYQANNRPLGGRGIDWDRWVWTQKRRVWQQFRPHLVTPSHWLAGCAATGLLSAQCPCTVIPNGIDTERFKPLDRTLARDALGLATQKQYILFGAADSTDDPRKGFTLLQAALRRLSQQCAAGRVELLVFGAWSARVPLDLGLPVHYLGELRDEYSLALLYSAADLFVAPSLQDNLPNTVVESLACGTPVVAFAIGGMPDMVKPGLCGALAKPFCADDLAQKMGDVLKVPAALWRAQCRSYAVGEYSEAVVAQRYQALYAQLRTPA